MKNSLKISSNFSIPWLGAFHSHLCPFGIFRRWIFIWKSIEQKKLRWLCLLHETSHHFQSLQHPLSAQMLLCFDRFDILELKLETLHEILRSWSLGCLHNDVSEVLWSQYLRHPKIQPYSEATNILEWSLEGLPAQSMLVSLWDLKLGTRKNQWFLYCFYISQLRCLTESAKKLWSVGWFTGVLKHHMIVQAMPAKLQWFISQPWPLEPCHPVTTT